MPPHRRFRAPAGNGSVLAEPGFDAVPALVEANRRLLDRDDVIVGGLPLRELRALARQEAIAKARELLVAWGYEQPRYSVDAPLILAGHQPELSHPGVWVKNFALNCMARKVGGTPLNLIVDNDTLKSAGLRAPLIRDLSTASVQLETVAFDRATTDLPYERRVILDPEYFRTFADRAAPLYRNWDFEPLLPSAWACLLGMWPDRVAPRAVGAAFTRLRVHYERQWGVSNHELPVGWLAGTEAFARFIRDLLADLPRFRDVYNSAVKRYRRAHRLHSEHHPVPELAENEAPFWLASGDRRQPLRVEYSRDEKDEVWIPSEGRSIRIPHIHDDPGALTPDWERRSQLELLIRPRALTLTLFARVCLGDFFIHGIGGGKYDEVTDDIIRNYFGLEPPAYQVLSATLHLPLPGFPSADADVDRAGRHVRDLHWNPQRHLTPEIAARPDVTALVREKERLAASEPPYGDHAARRAWFRDLAAVTGWLRERVADQAPGAEGAVTRTRAEAHANAVLRRRDYSWVLYPEETLWPFLQRFLEV